jgi:hypothetical protein
VFAVPVRQRLVKVVRCEHGKERTEDDGVDELLSAPSGDYYEKEEENNPEDGRIRQIKRKRRQRATRSAESQPVKPPPCMAKVQARRNQKSEANMQDVLKNVNVGQRHCRFLGAS